MVVNCNHIVVNPAIAEVVEVVNPVRKYSNPGVIIKVTVFAINMN
jgi:hypothetical protein